MLPTLAFSWHRLLQVYPERSKGHSSRFSSLLNNPPQSFIFRYILNCSSGEGEDRNFPTHYSPLTTHISIHILLIPVLSSCFKYFFASSFDNCPSSLITCNKAFSISCCLDLCPADKYGGACFYPCNNSCLFCMRCYINFFFPVSKARLIFVSTPVLKRFCISCLVKKIGRKCCSPKKSQFFLLCRWRLFQKKRTEGSDPVPGPIIIISLSAPGSLNDPFLRI